MIIYQTLSFCLQESKPIRMSRKVMHKMIGTMLSASRSSILMITILLIRTKRIFGKTKKHLMGKIFHMR